MKTKEVRRLSKWANKNYPEYQFEYGLRLITGDGVSKNESLGLYFIHASACSNYPNAINYLKTIKK